MSYNLETNETSINNLCQTHYYKCDYKALKEAFLEIIKNLGYEVFSIDDEYCEIFASNGKMEVTAKFIEQNRLETSVDFFLASGSFIGNRSKCLKLLDFLYKELGKRLQFKGMGLHK